MLDNMKFRTCFITFVLLFSLFSITILPVNNVKAEEPLLEEGNLLQQLLAIYGQFVNFDDPMAGHPYRFTAVWTSNETITIEGDMEFDLYFSSTILSSMEILDFRDEINVSVYSLKLGLLEQIENGNTTLTLEPELMGESIQKCSFKLKNINVTLHKDDSLLFEIELILSEKPISNYIERNYDKIMRRLEKIYNRLLDSNTPELKEIGMLIDALMENLSDLDIAGEDFGKLISDLRSSAFYYGSNSYKSKVKFTDDLDNESVLYFHNELDPINPEFGFIRTVNETAPTGDTDYMWPPIALESDEEAVEESEFFMWIVLWALYNLEIDEIPEGNIVTYYLHDNGIMDESAPEGSTSQRSDISKDSKSWTGPAFERNKILTNVKAELYIHYPKLLTLSKIQVKASLFDGEKELASDTKELDRTSLIELLQRGPDVPTMFTFDDYSGEEEIWNGGNLSLQVSVSSGPLLSLRPINIVYDSQDYPSLVTLTLNETENIQIEEFEDKKVYAGGSAEFVFNVTSEHEDTVQITVEEGEIIGDWTVEYYPKDPVEVDADGSILVHVFVNSTNNDVSAYDIPDQIDLLFSAAGLTGLDSQIAHVEVSEDAVEYDIEVIAPKDKKIKHGEEHTYTFIIRNMNKGQWHDQYSINVSSENGFNLSYDPYVGTKDDYLDVYSEEEPVEASVNVTIIVPEFTDIESDVLTFTIFSLESGKETFVTVNVTTKVIGANILESIYHMFQSAAEGWGLDDIFGEYAGWFLIFILLFLILFFVIVAAIVSKRKFVELICLDRVKEISTDETATFEVKVHNICKHVNTYEIKSLIDTPSQSWNVSLNTERIVVKPKQSEQVILTVTPTDYVKPDDWVEVKIIARPIDKKKAAKITTVTTIKNAKVNLKISGVLHWPRVFKKGDRVETSFKLYNRGNVSADNVSVILYVNGEEKNKVENITIPRGGYADIEMPWIAVKGKNEVYIVVK